MYTRVYIYEFFCVSQSLPISTAKSSVVSWRKSPLYKDRMVYKDRMDVNDSQATKFSAFGRNWRRRLLLVTQEALGVFFQDPTR